MLSPSECPACGADLNTCRLGDNDLHCAVCCAVVKPDGEVFRCGDCRFCARKWRMQLLLPDGWAFIAPVDGAPYEYAMRSEARHMLGICYPDQMREARLGAPEKVRIVTEISPGVWS